MDRDRFEERAAIMEFEGDMSRFRAETNAAAEQGATRWEALGDVARRVVSAARDQRQAVAGAERQGDMPGVQPHPTQEGRPVSKRIGN